MTLRIHAIAAIAAALLSSSSIAQVNFPEAEPNSQKSEANPVAGIVTGDTISGVTTGTTSTLGLTTLASADVFRVKTGALGLGIYQHTLTLSAGANTGAIRGQGQTGGAPNGADYTLQFGSASKNTWYGFGKQEEVYYQVGGTAATTAAYTATLSTATITPIAVAGLFNPGPITVTTYGQGHTNDTELYLYDGAFNPVPLGHNDDNSVSTQAKVSAILTAGTYYVAVSNYNTANNQGDANPTETFQNGDVLDFSDAILNTSTTTAYNVAFSVSDGGTTTPVAATKSATFEIVWATFTVQVNTNPPANDACASAQVIGNGTFGGITQYATNDGTATCDPGGAASRDVWFSYTNTTGLPIVLSADTCTSSVDTVLSVYDSCGGTELACNDDCGGAPCAATDSCVTVPLNIAQSVIIRVSDKGVGAGGLFVLHVQGGLGNDGCATPVALPGPGTYAFDTTTATTGTEGQVATTPCGSGPKQDLWYTYTATTNGGTIVVSTSGGQITSTDDDTKIVIYAGNCPTTAGIICDDDGGDSFTSIATFTGACSTTYTIQLGNFFTGDSITGTFTVTETGPTCATPFTTSCYGDGSGTACPCSNAGIAGRGCGNASFANGAELSSTGIASISADTLVLHGLNGSAFGAGLYFQGSANTSPAGAPFGHGLVCMSGATPRLEIVNPHDANGASQTVGVIHNEGGIAAPGTFHYQWWYRDGVTVGSCSSGAIAFNFSNAITLTWAP